MQSETIEATLQQEHIQRIAAEVMDITEVKTTASGHRGALEIYGQLKFDAQAVYAQIAPLFRDLGYTPLLQEMRRGVALIAVPGTINASRSRLWLSLLLFALTVASTTFVGGWHAGPNNTPSYSLGLGLAFSASLLSILLAHEMGHFLTARRFGVAVSYPFFIPMPFFPILGTMGAFIAMKEPPPDRRALLAIAIAGPLAGLVFAIPILVLGLNLSEVAPFTPGPDVYLEGNSLLYAGIKTAVFGRFLPSGGEDVMLHPVALAGWAGLLVTGLNLIPAGQLDGGHIFFSLFGAQISRIMTWIIVAVLIAMGFLWSGWFLWAVLIGLFGQQRAPLLNEVTPLSWPLRLLAIAGLIVFALVFTPTPITLFP